MRPDAILVLDFGGQYCHLIARRIREQSVYSEIVPHDISSRELGRCKESLNIKGFILSGGPESVYKKTSPKINSEILNSELPVLGLCYGHQLIAKVYGGFVESADRKEFGIASALIDRPVGVLKGLKARTQVWMSHGDTVFELSEDFEVLAHTKNSPIAAFRHRYKPIYGIQWHPEVIHTEEGDQVFRNFLFEVCGCIANWKIENVTQKLEDEMRGRVGRGRAVIALSGGIDSSTAAILGARILGRNLSAILVDHGFMRENETQNVQKLFKGSEIDLIVVDAKRRFLDRLVGVVDPEEKRRIIGEEFIKVFEEEAQKREAEFLIQGTIYPDRIESGFGKLSSKIKSHHNVAGLPKKIKFKEIIEPLANLYKDEVRQLARGLDLPEEIINRQPFPGPGLAVRIVGQVTEEKLAILRKADRILNEEVLRASLEKDLWQSFAVLTNTMSTGVKGDSRSYGYVVALRVVESREAMTAAFTKLPYEVLEKTSSRITNEIPKVSRVVYDITNKPPATIEWE
ncbi:MAG: glutamine-hydrolyzing GMP synthase [Candidatus Bathyarchaeota archaeon]|nr:MAG: glutamine-hydrolyzing GMP synthase [Candidatus Bathyarchaeota archaeon]